MYDVAVVGAGVFGLAHAYHFAKSGMKVGVFERNPRANGASVRNFGMLWPIGQKPGETHGIALRSREIWLQILRESGLWHETRGSLHLAYREDELETLREFISSAPARGFEVSLLSPVQIASISAGARLEGLLGGMFSASEVCIDPREAITHLPDFLAKTYGVEFHFGTVATRYDSPTLTAGGGDYRASRLFVCAGDDFETLYPEVFEKSGITRCKLQMMRTEPQPDAWRMGPMLAAGLTLRHYSSFADCPSLPALKKRVALENPKYDQYGIHVMASQNGRGEIVIGDSHEYGKMVSPFNSEEIDLLILDYLQTFLEAPNLKIASRWHGVYAKHPDLNWLVADPSPNVRVVASAGGTGMTLSFGLAERTVTDFL